MRRHARLSFAQWPGANAVAKSDADGAIRVDAADGVASLVLTPQRRIYTVEWWCPLDKPCQVRDVAVPSSRSPQVPPSRGQRLFEAEGTAVGVFYEHAQQRQCFLLAEPPSAAWAYPLLLAIEAAVWEGGPEAATPAPAEAVVVKATDDQADIAVDGADMQEGEQVTQEEGSELSYALPVAHKTNKQGIALCDACAGTDVEAVRQLLDAGAPIDYWDADNMPPLASVLTAAQYMMTEMQLEGTSAEECNFAAREAIFALLIEKSSPAVLDQVYSLGDPSDNLSLHSTALHTAFQAGFLDEANLLIDHGASGNIPAKMLPDKVFTAIELVMSSGPQSPEFFDTSQRIMWRLDGWTPLHAAAVWGKTEKFIELLEAGEVDTQARTKTQQLTAMELAKLGGTDFGTTGKNMEAVLETWEEQRLDGLTKLLNKGAFLDDVAKLEARGIDPAFFSIDIQGFKGVNDTIDHVAGDGALHYYAALLSSVVKEASTEEMKGVVYRTGGDELSVIWSKASGAPRDGFRHKVEAVAQTLAKVDHVVKGEKDGMAVEAPTFLRIGVGPTHHLADQAETEIRSQVYMKAFGSLDARGQMVSRSDARLEGVAMWMAVWE